MATEYFGDSYYEESLIVRCSCGDHLVEFYNYNVFGDYEYGIEFLGCYNYKKFPGYVGFKFLNKKQFIDFVDKCNNPTENEFTFISYMNTSNKTICENGYLKVEKDNFGWVSFSRYMKEKSKKVVWDFHIGIGEWKDFLKALNKFADKV